MDNDELSPFELDQLRQQNDLRLKTTFETIFEKYGKDFTGIGDEIDLETGEIVVDNGHISQMRNEQDVGEGAGKDMERLWRALTEPPGLERGIGRANRDAQDRRGQEIYDSEGWEELTSEGGQEAFGHPPNRAREAGERITPPLAGVYGDLDRRISRYAVQPNSVDDSRVEPAWRTPGPALPTPGTRPILRSVLRSRRGISASPIQQGSLWALPKRPGRPRKIPLDIFRDVLVPPRVPMGSKRVKPPSPIVISDDEGDREGHIPSNAGAGIRGSSNNRMESICNRMLISRSPNQSYGPRTTYGQRPIGSPSVRPDLEVILEKFRRRIDSERRGRNRGLRAVESPIFRDEGNHLTGLPREREHPSLKKFARNLFAASSSVDGYPRDSYNASDAIRQNHGR